MADAASTTLTTTPFLMPCEGDTPTPTIFNSLPLASPTSVQTLVVPTSMPTIVRSTATPFTFYA
jgi:hypothetical protein